MPRYAGVCREQPQAHARQSRPGAGVVWRRRAPSAPTCQSPARAASPNRCRRGCGARARRYEASRRACRSVAHARTRRRPAPSRVSIAIPALAPVPVASSLLPHGRQSSASTAHWTSPRTSLPSGTLCDAPVECMGVHGVRRRRYAADPATVFCAHGARRRLAARPRQPAERHALVRPRLQHVL